MLEDSDRLLATIEQMLRTGRIGSGKRKLNLVPVAIGDLVAECVPARPHAAQPCRPNRSNTIPARR